MHKQEFVSSLGLLYRDKAILMLFDNFPQYCNLYFFIFFLLLRITFVFFLRVEVGIAG